MYVELDSWTCWFRSHTSPCFKSSHPLAAWLIPSRVEEGLELFPGDIGKRGIVHSWTCNLLFFFEQSSIHESKLFTLLTLTHLISLITSPHLILAPISSLCCSLHCVMQVCESYSIISLISLRKPQYRKPLDRKVLILDCQIRQFSLSN